MLQSVCGTNSTDFRERVEVQPTLSHLAKFSDIENYLGKVNDNKKALYRRPNISLP